MHENTVCDVDIYIFSIITEYFHIPETFRECNFICVCSTTIPSEPGHVSDSLLNRTSRNSFCLVARPKYTLRLQAIIWSFGFVSFGFLAYAFPVYAVWAHFVRAYFVRAFVVRAFVARAYVLRPCAVKALWC